MKVLTSRLGVVLALLLMLGVLTLAAFPASTLAANQPGYAPASPPAPAWSGYGCSYSVRSGDNLYRLSVRFATSIYTLMSMNGLYNPNFIYRGMVMRVPCVSAYSASPYSPAYNRYPPTNYNTLYGSVCAYHLVLFGENLYRIGLRYGMTWTAIAAMNRIYNPDRIYAGMRLAIPCRAGMNVYAPASNPYAAPPPNAYPSTMNPYAPAPQAAPRAAPPPAQAGSVSIQDFSFAPASIMIRAGQTVVWRNNGPSAHTTTSDNGVWDSGSLGVGGTFSHTFSSAGTFTYHCAIHPFMHGTVVVTQ